MSECERPTKTITLKRTCDGIDVVDEPDEDDDQPEVEACSFEISSDHLLVEKTGDCSFTINLPEDLLCPENDCDECCPEISPDDECTGLTGTFNGLRFECGELIDAESVTEVTLPEGEFCPAKITVEDGQITNVEECLDSTGVPLESECFNIDTTDPEKVTIGPPLNVIADGDYNGFTVECGFIMAYVGETGIGSITSSDNTISISNNNGVVDLSIGNICDEVLDCLANLQAGVWAGNADFSTIAETNLTASDDGPLCVRYDFPEDIGSTGYIVTVVDGNGATAAVTITRATDHFVVCYPDNSTYYLSVIG